MSAGHSPLPVAKHSKDLQVRRRYSEFASLRQTLVNLHPTLIVPPIPEKHSMADYAAKPTKAKEDAGIIELRKRMLAVFLNRCRRMPHVLGDGVFWKFLDPNVSWVSVCLLSSTYGLMILERGAEHSASRHHPQERPQGAAAGHGEPHRCSFLPTRSLRQCKIKVGGKHHAVRDTGGPFKRAVCRNCPTHRSVSDILPKSVRGGSRSLFHQL
jgi:hypothetical protein